jgi:aspartokinase-like uncharacterized kinase
MSDIRSPIVIKVGGSLFDWPNLRERLHAWLEREVNERALIVPGGGPFVDALRVLDSRQLLGEEVSHWLALRMLTLNAHFLLELLPESALVSDLESCERVWRRNRPALLDALEFARADDACNGSLPHTWEVTSDSIAARAARLIGARKLILLKSSDDPTQGDWVEAGRQGYVDPYFARVIWDELTVQAVNLREWQASTGTEREPRPGGEHDRDR